MVEQYEREQEQHLDVVFHALSDQTRRAMLRQLAVCERTVSELAEPFAMSLAAASKHVKSLERAGLVTRTISGRTHWCQLNPGPLAEAQIFLRYYERFWDVRLDALHKMFATDSDKEEVR
jgi:DNA-binding transcriptional ArsR family regulator